jgi:hypothetical protein
MLYENNMYRFSIYNAIFPFSVSDVKCYMKMPATHFAQNKNDTRQLTNHITATNYQWLFSTSYAGAS